MIGRFLVVGCLLLTTNLAAGPGDNLAPNSSFEEVTDGAPTGWRWSAGRARARLAVDPTVARSGRQSVRFENDSPFEPEVYGGLSTTVPVTPGRTYTLSCYVRGRPGRAWIGGAHGWRVRRALPDSPDRWTRVSITFQTAEDEAAVPLRINTDGVTPGFWIDDVQLEEGEQVIAYHPPPGPGELRLILDPSGSGVGRNLLPNASFEIVDGNRPKGWAWDKRNTNATFAIVPMARTGGNAIRFTNGTPQSPHVCGQLILVGGLSLEPGKTYTLSCYAKSENPGPAWIGGGDGWWMRLGLRGTGGEWKRFVRTFTARDGDARFPLMINTDGVTGGFLIDDVKLEEGEAATPFIDPNGPAIEASLVADVPKVLSCGGGAVWLPCYLYSHVPRRGIPVVARITGRSRETLSETTLAADFDEGLSRLLLWWNPGDASRQSCRLTITVGEPPLASYEATFEVYTLASFEAADVAAGEAIERLDAAIREAKAAGQRVTYAAAALQVGRHFRGVAREKQRHDRLPDAVADLDYLAGLATEAVAGVEAIRAGRAEDPAIPDPPMTDLTIRDGGFWAGDQPVMLIGGMGYGQLHDELDTVPDYGFNLAGDDWDNGYSALRMMTGPGQHDETAVPKLRASWDDLQRRNLAISFNPTLHYFPFWAMEAHPDITGGEGVDQLPDWSGLGRHRGKRTKSYGGFFPFAIDSPSLRRLVSDYYAALFAGVADHPAFRIVWLMNEPTYGSTDPHYLQLYREYLRRKFGDLAKLNDTWGTAYTEFGAIGAPEGSTDPARFDWLTFHQDQVASWFEWLAAEVKKHDPNAVLSNKPMAWTLLHPDKGIDWEREAELWEVPGCDAGRSPHNSKYAFGWAGATMLFDFQKSIAPDKPLGDFEYHYVHQPIETSAYPRVTYWHSYLHGLRVSAFWVWATGQLGKDAVGAGMKDTAWSQPKVAWGTAQTALDLRRLAPYVAAFPGPAEVRLYYSRPSLYRDNAAHSGTILDAYIAANGLDAPVGFVTDKMIRAGRLEGVKLLIVPAARLVEADVREQIAAYAKEGGRTLMIGECLTGNEYGRPYPDDIAGPGVRRIERAAPDGLVPAIDEAMTAAGVTRPIRSTTADDLPAWPIECRSRRIDGERICYLIGLNKEPSTVKLSAEPAVAGWEDLISGERGDGAELVVGPLDVRLLRLRMDSKAGD